MTKPRQGRHIGKMSHLKELEILGNWFLQRWHAYGARNWRQESSYAKMMNMNENIYEQLQEQEQAKLNAAGLTDVKFSVGWFRNGDALRLEARLTGPAESKRKARELLSFSDSE
jgi:hypothetical protein